MKRWALISGLRGDLELYEQIQVELKHQRQGWHGDMKSLHGP